MTTTTKRPIPDGRVLHSIGLPDESIMRLLPRRLAINLQRLAERFVATQQVIPEGLLDRDQVAVQGASGLLILRQRLDAAEAIIDTSDDPTKVDTANRFLGRFHPVFERMQGELVALQEQADSSLHEWAATFVESPEYRQLDYSVRQRITELRS